MLRQVAISEQVVTLGQVAISEQVVTLGQVATNKSPALLTARMLCCTVFTVLFNATLS